jgi:hypothetical protein
MGSVIVLSLLVVATFILLCYMFNASKVELETPTIAAMEARAEAVEKTRSEGRVDDEGQTPRRGRVVAEVSKVREMEPDVPVATPLSMPTYEYRELLVEGGENYVLPQWMVNFFSSGDLCHTLDSSDNVVFMAKLNDARGVDGQGVEITAEPDMGTQTIAFKLGFGQSAAAETIKTKFYLFERGDLFELNRLVRQKDVRIDLLTRAPDYTLEYSHTIHTRLDPGLLTQLKNVLAKIPA